MVRLRNTGFKPQSSVTLCTVIVLSRYQLFLLRGHKFRLRSLFFLSKTTLQKERFILTVLDLLQYLNEFMYYSHQLAKSYGRHIRPYISRPFLHSFQNFYLNNNAFTWPCPLIPV
jgi:hypothetical protein